MSIKLFIDVRSQDITNLYEDWNWLLKPEDIQAPILMNTFGDLFFQTDGGEILFLDTIRGATDKITDSLSELQNILNDQGMQNRLLFSSLVDALVDQGMVLDDTQLYSFKIPLHLGGELAVENVEIGDREVALSILGQIQAQTINLAAGTKLNGLGIKQDLPSRLQ